MTLSEAFLRLMPRFAMRRMVEFLDQRHTGRIELHVAHGRIQRVSCTDYTSEEHSEADPG